MKRVQRINRVTRKRPPRRSKFWPIILVLAALTGVLQLALVGVLVTASGAGAVSYYNQVSTSGIAQLKSKPRYLTTRPTTIYDRNGRVIWQISDPNKGLQIYEPLNKIPQVMRQAIIASEDRSFYTNAGVSPTGIASALLRDLRHRQAVAGASTITQQVIKLQVFGSINGSYQRKLQEALIAYAVAQPHSGFSKNRILELYLNVASFGQNTQGVEAAAKVYFGKDVWQLDLARAALLAGLVQAPSAYDPIANGPTLALWRMRTHVLPLMVKSHYITKAQSQAAYKEAQRFTFNEPHLRPIVTKNNAPYWTDWIMAVLGYRPLSYVPVNQQLAALVDGAGGFTNGLAITTTLDLDMYDQAQQIMNNDIAPIAFHNVTDAAVVQIDPKTGECLNMVGGVDYSQSQYNFGADPRSPGSSFKVFNYLTAFERLGWSPAHMLLDEHQEYPDPTSSNPDNMYVPANYDKSYHGAVTVRMALANSYNIPAVETIHDVGKGPVLKTAEEMGVPYLKTYNPNNVGLSLTLGAQAVPLWEMAQGYTTFANAGVYRPMASILAIDDASGKRLYTYHAPSGVRVVAPQYTYLITSILKDNYARVPAFGVDSVLQLDRPAAVKTGTSQYFKDNLTIGYTPNLVTATWVGNPDDSAMDNIEGVDGAGPIWHDVMEWSFAHLNLPVEDFKVPPGVSLVKVSSSGYLASNATRWPITDVYAAGTVPHQFDPGYGPDYNDYTAYRVLGYNFSLDGGTTSSLYAGQNGSSTPVAGATAGPEATPSAGGAASGTSGYITYNPGSSANLCANGGRYVYNPVYQNGKVVYHYTCL